MKVNLTYVFDTKDGFRYERETPSEILEIARENYKALKELATGEGDYCDWYIDESKPLFPSGIITAEIDGFHRQYNLTTIVEPITEEETPAEEDDDLAPELRKGIEYVRENIEEEDIAILRAKTSKAYKAHLTPDCYCDTDKVIELLGEYGEENDLEESWWEDYADINDIIFELIK